MVRGGQYDFSFKSWKWKDYDSHPYCNCVRNNSQSRSVYIRWQTDGSPSLNTFVPPDAAAYVYQSADKDNFINVKSSLWYGAGLTKLETNAVRPKDDARAEFKPPLVTVSAAGQLNMVDQKIPQNLRTESLVYFPIGIAGTPTFGTDDIASIEEGSKSLVPVHMEMSSSLQLNADNQIEGITVSCSYEVGDGTRLMIPPIRLRIGDQALQDKLADGKELTLESAWKGGAKQSFSAYTDVTAIDAARLKKANAALELIADDGSVVASIPFEFHQVGQ
ncbi:hypothetical protein GR198_28505 [Rhizobium leguminosarum]|uniref:hypothetical protein n=1 Tax=Rhizobium leguminosarum TaxID=384 RepID=UPI0013C090AE|nr:hypothetical protein [Rhizobium leguminosarum]NEH59669.1 hypothetical protein [Rhizobium leguminosarum]